MKMSTPFLWSLLVIAACVGESPEAQEEDAPPTVDVVAAPPDPSRQELEIPGRPCRADAFFIEVPLRLTGPAWGSVDDLSGAVITALDPLANAPSRPWFCGEGQTSCPAGEVRVDVSSLLEPVASPAVRADGHRRFFRVHFVEGSTGDTLSVRPEAQCDVVSSLRDALAPLAPADAVYVGRECDAAALGVEAVATHEMRTWHLDRLGLPDILETQPPDPDYPVVDVALIDSGVDPAVGEAIGLASMYDFSDGGAALHPHGTGMAVLVRQAAPNAAIHSLRVFDEGGFARSGALAQAIDTALREGSGPLVINLSLGWPSQLSQPAALIGENNCSTYEDPVGESVRYLLYVAQQLERPVFVAAAAGNQPAPVDPSLFPPAPEAPDYECSSGAPPGNPWFLPAWWQHLDSCRASEPGPLRLALGVGAVDDRDRPSLLSIPDSESPLVGPGQHVYADHPAGTPPDLEPICAGDPPPVHPAPVMLPMAMTGTSVGAVLVSGAAAHAQGIRLDLGQQPFARDALARILYSSGESVCDASGSARLTPAGAPVRRLNVERLDHVLSDESCKDLVQCAEEADGLDPIGASLLHDCRHDLEECGLETLDAWGEIEVDCGDPQAVSWPVDYAATATICSEADIDGSFEDAGACGAGGCPYEDVTYRTLIGSLGPSPDVPVCPDCELQAQSSSASATLFLELNPRLEPGTVISEPYLVVEGSAGGISVKQYVDLLSYTSTQDWTPGASLVLTVGLEKLPAGFDWSTAAAFLVTTVTEPDKVSATDRSPLRVRI